MEKTKQNVDLDQPRALKHERFSGRSRSRGDKLDQAEHQNQDQGRAQNNSQSTPRNQDQFRNVNKEQSRQGSYWARNKGQYASQDQVRTGHQHKSRDQNLDQNLDQQRDQEPTSDWSNANYQSKRSRMESEPDKISIEKTTVEKHKHASIQGPIQARLRHSYLQASGSKTGVKSPSSTKDDSVEKHRKFDHNQHNDRSRSVTHSGKHGSSDECRRTKDNSSRSSQSSHQHSATNCSKSSHNNFAGRPPQTDRDNDSSGRNQKNTGSRSHTLYSNSELGRLRGRFIHRGISWKAFDGFSSPSSATSVPFRIVSYNVLSQDLLEANDHLYHHCDPAHLRWEYRKQQFVYELRHLNADVLCLQEVNCDHYAEFFQPFLKAEGYRGCYVKRSGHHKDGCATFIRSAIFVMEEEIPVHYHRKDVSVLDRDNVAMLVKLSCIKNAAVKLCVSNTHVLFNPKRGDVKLAQLMVLLAELDKLASMGTDQEGNPVYYPVILTGDFNLLPFCDLHRFLAHGQLRYEGLVIREMAGQGEYGRNVLMTKDFLAKEAGISDKCQYVAKHAKEKGATEVPSAQPCADLRWVDPAILAFVPALKAPQTQNDQNFIPLKPQTHGTLERATVPNPSPLPPFGSGCVSHRFNLKSAYDHGHPLNPEATTCHSKANCTVDYIFYSRHTKTSHPEIKPPRLKHVSNTNLWTNQEMYNAGGLPNAVIASDHISLAACFILET